MAEINVTLKGSKISLGEPYITSGSVGTVSCRFSFDGEWDGYSKTVIFFQNPRSAKHQVLGTTELSCMVPGEMLALAKPLYVGVFGTRGDEVLTSGVAAVKVFAGSYRASDAPEEPTPDVYAQILDLVELYRTANEQNAAAAYQSEQNAKEYALDAQEASGLADAAYAAIVTEEEAREIAELDRVSAELYRVSAEEDRISAEAERVSAEEDRVLAEAARESAEEDRVLAETARAASYGALSTKVSANTTSIKTIESKLTEANPNRDPRVLITSAAPSIDIPKTAASGGVDVAIRGVTLTNTVDNGDFSNGVARWTKNSSATVLSVSENTLTVTAGGHAASLSVYQVPTTPTVAGVTYYISYSINPFRTHTPQMYFGNDIVTMSQTAEAGAFTRVSQIITPTKSGGNVTMYINGSSGWEELEIGSKTKFRNVMLINLTAHGLEHLTKEQLDYMTETYLDGTKSAVAPRFRSVGKNTFILSDALKNPRYTVQSYMGELCISWLANNSMDTLNGAMLTDIFKPNTRYTFSFEIALASGDGSAKLVYTDGTEQPIGYSASGQGFIKRTDTSAAGKTIKAFMGQHNAGQRVYLKLSSIQIEKGTTATPYEPYRESALYTEPYRVRRTTEGVYDEIAGGKLIRRVNEDGTALTTPVIVENVTSGTLISYPGGMIYAEPALADAGVYNQGISVFYTDFPIDTLETVKRVDFETGEQMPLDASHAVISPDGKSFTHWDLADGDIVFFTYFYDVPSVGSMNTYSYLDSREVVADTVNGKFYAYKPVITNGAIASWTVHEV